MSSRKINFNQKIENVRMLDRYNPRKICMGTLFVTSTHIAFTQTDPDSKKETWILLWHISSFEKLPLTTIGCPLQIRTKNFRTAVFVIPRERDCHAIYTILQQICQPGRKLLGLKKLSKLPIAHVEQLYCFRYTSSDDEIPKSAGWTFFDVQAEFQRMRVPNEQWSICHLNKNYELCDTYPSIVFVPSYASTQVLIGSSKFRSKGRLPVLTYLHSNKAAICRCSQPLSGFNARCYKDEEMLDCIVKTNPYASYMVVVDTRPRINAMANRATGKGYENENFYENIKFNFYGIENIHVMRNSLSKLIETCELKSPTMSAFLSGLESSGWLKHIKSILDTSWFIAKSIISGISVLVHCSDGWDRTAQVCSLASVLLDPFYRTVHGFQALIEKDWLSFGHKFMDRVGFLAVDSKEISPVFTQFIECAWQLMTQFPAAFQFNEQFLFTIHDHCCSCRFGTFIGNSEKQRVQLRLSERTFSLWGYMANHTNEYINPLYEPDLYPGVLRPHLISQNIRFWRGMYCRFESGVQPRENMFESVTVSTDHYNSLNEHIKFLQKKIAATKTKIIGKNSRKPEELTTKIGNSLNSFFKKESFKLNFVEDPLRVGTCAVFSKAKESTNSIDALADDFTALSIDWKTLRSAKGCAMKDCPSLFDSCTRKFHCQQCGDLFCSRCIARHTILPGHLGHCAVPVCKYCYAKLNKSSTQNI